MWNAPKRIAIVIPTLGDESPEQTGGAQRVAINLCQVLVERAVAVDLVTFRGIGFYAHALPSTVNLVDLGIRKPFSWAALLSASLRFKCYFQTAQPDAVYCFDNRANIAAIAARMLARSHARVVGSVHNTLTMRWRPLYPRWLQHLLNLGLLLAYKHADGIVAVSSGVAQDLVTNLHLPQGKVRVIYNPVVSPQLLERADAPLQHPWFSDKGLPIIIGVGRLTKAKDFSTLICAFAIVQRTTAARLVILGEGRERPALEALVRQLGLRDVVQLPGFVENPYAYMKRASLFVLSSAWEGLPTVLIEALACGTPVVSTDCPSGPREILENGRWGKLVPVGDPGAMARAIEDALERRVSPPQESWTRFTYAAVGNEYVRYLFQ